MHIPLPIKDFVDVHFAHTLILLISFLEDMKNAHCLLNKLCLQFVDILRCAAGCKNLCYDDMVIVVECKTINEIHICVYDVYEWVLYGGYYSDGRSRV